MCKAELKRCLPAENDDNDFHFASVFQNLVDRAAEAAERTVSDLNRLADLIVDNCLRLAVGVFVLDTEDPLGLFLRCLSSQ